MKKVAFLQKTNKYSGAENVVITIMNLLPKDQYECIYVSPDGEIREYVENEGLQFYALPKVSLKSIAKAIKKIKPDIIHATDYGMSSYAAILNLEIPIVAHLHNNVPWLKNPIYPKTLFFAKALSNIDQVISVSSSIADEFVYKKRLENKNHVIFNIVDLNRIKKLSEESDVKSQLKFDIAFLGRLTIQKNPFLFCDIIKEYKRINQYVSAVMIGDGELKPKIQQYIEKNNLKQNITLAGFQKNPYKIVANTKLLLMPSKYEGFGLAAVECLSLGKPVVSSGVGGLKDIITPACGAICENKIDYITEIKKLLQDENYYNKKSVEAKKEAKKFGDMNDYICKILKVYKKSLK